MPKGRIGLSLEPDVLAILDAKGRCNFFPKGNDWQRCCWCQKLASDKRHSDKRPTRTQIIETAVREWAERSTTPPDDSPTNSLRTKKQCLPTAKARAAREAKKESNK